MTDPLREDDEELAREWPLPVPPAPLRPPGDDDPAVLLLAATRWQAAVPLTVTFVVGVLGLALCTRLPIALAVPVAIGLAVLFFVALRLYGAHVLGPQGSLAVDAGRVDLSHPSLREPVELDLAAVHSVVRGPVPFVEARSFLAKLDPAEAAGRLLPGTYWVEELAPPRAGRAADHGRPDLLLVLDPAVPLRSRSRRPRDARGIALRLAEPGMVDVVLPQVFGRRLVDRLADDAWAYLHQEDARFAVDPADWVRTRVR